MTPAVFRCPQLGKWARLYALLDDHALKIGAAGLPKPPVLSGWWAWPASLKHEQWLQTVAWAESHHLAYLLADLTDSDFCTWPFDLPPMRDEPWDNFPHA